MPTSLAVTPLWRSTKLRRSLFATVAGLGATLMAAGCSAGYDIPPLPEASGQLKGDYLCEIDDEPGQVDPCSQDCLTATCASATGRRVCTCEGGVFLQCACLPPETWPFDDIPSAPYCDRLTGQPKYLSGERCSEGLTCISGDFPEQGCTCKLNTWQCGSSDGVRAGGPACESYGTGLFPVLKGQPCDTESQLCVSRDFNATGTSPRGCVCQLDGAQLLWTCGPTNRWWRAQ